MCIYVVPCFLWNVLCSFDRSAFPKSKKSLWQTKTVASRHEENVSEKDLCTFTLGYWIKLHKLYLVLCTCTLEGRALFTRSYFMQHVPGFVKALKCQVHCMRCYVCHVRNYKRALPQMQEVDKMWEDWAQENDFTIGRGAKKMVTLKESSWKPTKVGEYIQCAHRGTQALPLVSWASRKFF